MKIAFWSSDKPREWKLAKAFCRGAESHGHTTEVRSLGSPLPVDDYDLGCFVGVKAHALYLAHKAAGTRFLMIDKGYSRHRDPADPAFWEYWRFSLDAHHPTETTLMKAKMPDDRYAALKMEEKRWRWKGFSILLAGSSEKYHRFYGLPDPTTWAKAVVAEIKKHTDIPIIYRPKPSWKGAVEIHGTRYSDAKQALSEALGGAHAVVTHGSNICFEAALGGIPTIVLGNAIAKPISSTSLADIETPLMEKRGQWLSNVAYHQWTISEIKRGAAWEMIERWLSYAAE